jgi:histidine triad (HIT) family protein
MSSQDCIFCKITAGEIPATVLYKDELVTAIRDLNPVAPTHVLILSNRHVQSVNDATPEEERLFGRLFTVARKIAEQEGVSDGGYRVVVNTGEHGGQTVPHLHMHVIGGQAMHWPPG